jgi:uncharacterized protein (DUF486 family)
MPIPLQTAGLLILSNLFMTYAWYGHLKTMAARPWYVAALASWAVALFEYLLQVPANRIGFQRMSLGQLKILQEVITLSVFAPFAVLYMKQSLRLDFLWAGLCLLGALAGPAMRSSIAPTARCFAPSTWMPLLLCCSGGSASCAPRLTATT